MTNLQDSILAACFNADPLPLTPVEIWQRIDDRDEPLSLTELTLAVIELENDGYLESFGGIFSVLTPQGKRQAVKYAAAELLLKIAPEAIEFAQDSGGDLSQKNRLDIELEMPSVTGKSKNLPIVPDAQCLRKQEGCTDTMQTDTTSHSKSNGCVSPVITNWIEKPASQMDTECAEISSQMLTCSIVASEVPACTVEGHGDPSRTDNLQSQQQTHNAERSVKSAGDEGETDIAEILGDPLKRVSEYQASPAGMNFAAPVANTSLVTDLHGGSEGELAGNADSLSVTRQEVMPSAIRYKTGASASGASFVNGAGLASDASIMEALFPEIYATAKRCEDVCSFPDCGSLAHRTCPCGARTCHNHLYDGEGNLARRDEQGFCAACVDLIREEAGGIERYGRTV